MSVGGEREGRGNEGDVPKTVEENAAAPIMATLIAWISAEVRVRASAYEERLPAARNLSYRIEYAAASSAGGM